MQRETLGQRRRRSWGPLRRNLKRASLLPLSAGRHVFSVATGFLLIYYPFGNGVIHAFVPSLLVYACMLRFRQHCGTLAWLVAFPYLILA